MSATERLVTIDKHFEQELEVKPKSESDKNALNEMMTFYSWAEREGGTVVDTHAEGIKIKAITFPENKIASNGLSVIAEATSNSADDDIKRHLHIVR